MTDDLLRRAYAAYFRAGANIQPSADASGSVKHKGLLYVVLRNTTGTLAVYRIKNDGVLRRLKRWPTALNG